MTETKPQTAIQKAPSPLDPENMEQAVALSTRIAASGIIPDSLRQKPNDVLVVLLTGRDLGLSVAESMRAIYVVKGRPSLATAFKIARAKQHPDCEYFRLIESTPERATWETKRKGDPEATRITWTIAQEKLAGLAGKGTGANFPDAMLRWRAGGALVDAVYPDASFGLLPSKEEIEDLPPESPLPRDVTPPSAPKPEVAPPAKEEPIDAEFTEAAKAEAQPTPDAAPEPTEDPFAKSMGWVEQAKDAAELGDVATLLAGLPSEIRKAPGFQAVRDAYAAKKAALS